MKICELKRMMKNSRTWCWRSVEGNKGLYYTNTEGSGMFFQSDTQDYVIKLLSYERFKVCKTPGGTRKKLNNIFKECQEDPCDNENFIEEYFKPQFKSRLKCVSKRKRSNK